MNIVTLFSNLIKPAFDVIFKWKSESNKMELSRQEFELMKKQLQSEVEVRMAEEMRKPESEFRSFVLDYEGKASEQSVFMRNLRSSVRPVITYWALIIITAIMFGVVNTAALEANMRAIPDPLWQIFLTIFGFWFGGRALMQVAEVWKRGDTEKEEAKLHHERVKHSRIQSQIRSEKKKNPTNYEDDNYWEDGQ